MQTNGQMRRLLLVFGAAFAVLVIMLGAGLLVRKHNADMARAEAKAKYESVKAADDGVASAMNHLNQIDTVFDETAQEAIAAGKECHDIANENPYDYADALSAARKQKADVERLQGLSQEKVAAASSVATALGMYYGQSVASSLLGEVTNASEAEGKSLADWERAASEINDIWTAQANREWSYGSPQDIESLFRSSDEERAVSSSRWQTVGAKIIDLRNRLDDDVRLAKVRAGGTEESPHPSPTDI